MMFAILFIFGTSALVILATLTVDIISQIRSERKEEREKEWQESQVLAMQKRLRTAQLTESTIALQVVKPIRNNRRGAHRRVA